MYYHSRDLKYVVYGKVLPPPIESIDDVFIRSYRWLGQYCNFFPQIWVSRSRSYLTGFKYQQGWSTSYKNGSRKTKFDKKGDNILFGFDIIKGFPVSFEMWEWILMIVDDPKESSLKIAKTLEEYLDDPEIGAETKWIGAWAKYRDRKDKLQAVNEYLKETLFVENDQVVLPSLNLKAAKKIICTNERQKKTLRKMGFIEDRIEIKNFKPPSY